MSIEERTLIVLHTFVGVGAFVAGFMTILNPQEPLGISVELLKNSPFTNYLIPGIILFSVIGIGNLFSATCVGLKFRYQGYTSSVFSWALVIWIIVQCIMMDLINFMQALFFIIGLIEVGLSTIILFKKQLFPTNMIMRFLKREK
jgi:hypothetical protein